MKNLNDYIVEELSKPKKWTEIVDGILKSSKGISKEVLVNMLSTLYPERLKTLSYYWNSIDSSKFLPYQPSDDEFLKEENKNKICSQLSDYIMKNQ